MTRPILIMAGGTGGHIFPGLAVAEELRRAGVPVVWLGTPQGLESQLVPPHGIPLVYINARGLRGTGLQRWLKAPWMLLTALLQALRAVYRIRPAVVVGMGGFASGPGGLVARLLGIPLVVHEQNAIAGFTNRCLSKLTRHVFQAFPGAFAANKAHTVGNPVRHSISALAEPQQRMQDRLTAKPRLLVLGGSQGAQALNLGLAQALALIPAEQRPEVWHQAGAKLLPAAQAAYAEYGVEVRLVPFIDDMAHAYAWADLVLCRSGALTVAELAAVGVASLLVPFPHAVDDHQTANAGFLVQAGAAELLPQAELTPQRLADQLQALFSDRERLLHMAQAARRVATPEAAQQVAQRCLTLAQPREPSHDSL